MAKGSIGREKEVDVREEMRIALFWRGLIGDFEYIKFDPDDLLRWYMALELRGPEEVRDHLTERFSSRPMPSMTGLVAKRPHPPLWLVREWLAYHETKVRTGAFWWGTIIFITASFMTFPVLYGCVALQPLNPLVMNPPTSTPQMTQTMTTPQSYNITPGMSPPTVTQPGAQPTSPQSLGIAGTTGPAPASGAPASPGTAAAPSQAAPY